MTKGKCLKHSTHTKPKTSNTCAARSTLFLYQHQLTKTTMKLESRRSHELSRNYCVVRRVLFHKHISWNFVTFGWFCYCNVKTCKIIMVQNVRNILYLCAFLCVMTIFILIREVLNMYQRIMKHYEEHESKNRENELW